MRRERMAAAAAAAVLLGTGLAVASPASAAADDPADPAAPGAVALDDAVLRWGVNHETSNRAHAPDTFNFLSAGLVPDPGRGGTTLPRSRWEQRAGAVEVQKWSGTRWRAATWEGLSTDAAGKPLGSPSSGSTSGLRFTIGSGEGWVNPAAGTARVAWDGDVTVLYYSGMSMFHVSDPVLDVADGRGTLTATVRGYASSIDDPGSWAPVPAASVTLADLPDVDLGDGSATGVIAQPAYLGVTSDVAGQVTDSEWAGAFPRSFVAYQDRLGTAPFWFSTGSATDRFKVPLPLSVSYDAAADDPGPTPTQPPTQPPITNPTVDPPSPTATPTATPSSPPVAPAVPAPVAPTPAVAPPAAVVPSAPAAAAVPTGATAPTAPAALPASTQLVSARPAPAFEEPLPVSPWWVGGGLLLAAALVLLLPDPRRDRVTREKRTP
ncbi:hypothetical protein [Nocardioides dongkuii]|uniref:hypothetical protein n=1 Tax=Nocardioides dongkuii TaxID=2760089 RepID=UPI0015FBE8B5|nr:hypothetical protein [Nocardioides dongkuii]